METRIVETSGVGQCERCKALLGRSSYFFGEKGPLCLMCLRELDMAHRIERDKRNREDMTFLGWIVRMFKGGK